MKRAAARCWALPLPDEAKFSGLPLARAMNDGTSCAGTAAFTVSSSGVVAMRITGVKSRITSYGSFG